VSERLQRVTALYERSSAELERAARHARLASDLFAAREVPRGAAHALAAEGHVVSARQAMEEAAQLHSSASRLPDDGAGE
jgi:hypothetical protein